MLRYGVWEVFIFFAIVDLRIDFSEVNSCYKVSMMKLREFTAL